MGVEEIYNSILTHGKKFTQKTFDTATNVVNRLEGHHATSSSSNNDGQNNIKSSSKASSSSTNGNSNQVFSALGAPTTSVRFFILLFSVIVGTFFASQSARVNHFYRVYFKRDFYTWGVELALHILDIFMIITIVPYIWNAADPAAGSATDYFYAVEGLWIAFQGFKYMWAILFWTYHHSVVSILFSFFFLLIAWVIVIILMALFAVRSMWVEFVFALLAVFGYLAFLFFHGYVLRRAFHHLRHHSPHNSHHGIQEEQMAKINIAQKQQQMNGKQGMKPMGKPLFPGNGNKLT